MPKEGNDKAWPFASKEVDRHEPIEGGYQITAPPRMSSNPAAKRSAENRPWADEPYPVKQMNEPEMGREPLSVLKAQVEDLVNSPTHYAHGAIECIDAIRQALGKDQFEGFCHGNAIKYLWRANFKGTRERDLQKATWYMRMLTGDDPRKVK